MYPLGRGVSNLLATFSKYRMVSICNDYILFNSVKNSIALSKFWLLIYKTFHGDLLDTAICNLVLGRDRYIFRLMNSKSTKIFVFFLIFTIFLLLSSNLLPRQSLKHSIAQAAPKLEIDHVMLRVPNYEETVTWYEEKLGFKEVLRWQEPSLPGVNLGYLELNGFRLEILGGGEDLPEQAIADPADVPEHTLYEGYRHLCLRTSDVDATIADLQRKGVSAFAELYNYPPVQRRLAFILDNNGNAIEFSGPLKNE